MNPSSPNAAQLNLEVHGARASSVIVHRVLPESTGVFLEWQRGITGAAAEFPGYQTTEVYPPAICRGQEWVVIVHFDDVKTLQDWLDAPKRAEWTAKLPAEFATFRQKTLSAGFGPWFAVDGGELPSHWKMALTVLFGLYPAVMLLTLFLSPHTQYFGLAVAMLIGNAVSVCFLEWFGMPALMRLLGPWLRAKGKEGRVLSLVGAGLILAALGLMTFLFHLATREP